MAFQMGEEQIHLKAQKVQHFQNTVQIRFSWDADICFAQVLEACGAIPIPPYLHRESEKLDEERYQTVYSKFLGSVAAPTAGLHFTDEVLCRLQSKHIQLAELTLHVGAGTFKPVKSETIDQHEMHAETFRVHRTFLELLICQIESKYPIVAVGTTSVRTLESLYWLGCKYLKEPENFEPHIPQWMPYDDPEVLDSKLALTAILSYLEHNELETLDASTQIIIAPSYEFRLVDQIITNFHQPQSTLLLLISAFIGESWKNVYEYALKQGFRFLSYGDSSLLIP